MDNRLTEGSWVANDDMQLFKVVSINNDKIILKGLDDLELIYNDSDYELVGFRNYQYNEIKHLCGKTITFKENGYVEVNEVIFRVEKLCNTFYINNRPEDFYFKCNTLIDFKIPFGIPFIIE